MKIGYIVHDLNDPSVARRCEMLERGGAKVVLTGFYRGSQLTKKIQRRNPLVLGTTHDAAFLLRALNTVKHAVFTKRVENYLIECETILARNLEQLAIGARINGSRPLIYECLDIHRLLVSPSIPAKLIQHLENKLLPRVDLLLTSSPGFIRNHFEKTSLDCPTYLIENKFSISTPPTTLCPSKEPSPVLKIGWFGMLRCQKSFSMLREIVSCSEGGIEVIIAGKPSTSELPNLAQEAGTLAGIEFTGPYDYQDLAALYNKCHFAWAVDWFEEGLNSDWLLPNRLYESIGHGALPIVLEETEMHQWLKERDAGVPIKKDAAAKSIAEKLCSLDLSRLQKKLHAIPVHDVFADEKDALNLVQAITKTEKL